MIEIAFDDVPEAGIEFGHELEKDWVTPLVGPQFIADPRPLHAEFSLRRNGSSVVARGNITGEMKFLCSRCAEEAPYHVAIEFMHVFIRGRESSGVVRDLCGDVEFTFFEDDVVDLEPLAAEELVLSLPQIPLCSEACKGICQHCGRNLNEGPCGCHVEAIDPRWARLRDLKP